MFRIGDKAKLKDERGEVTITKIVSALIVMAEGEDGLELRFRKDQLIRIDSSNAFTKETLLKGNLLNPKSAKDAPKKSKKQTSLAGRKKNNPDDDYIDIHDYALAPKYRQMLQLSKMDQSLHCFEDALWASIKRGASRLTVNHGIGEEVLKTEIRRRLDERGYTYHDESVSNPGTTVVYLKDTL